MSACIALDYFTLHIYAPEQPRSQASVYRRNTEQDMKTCQNETRHVATLPR